MTRILFLVLMIGLLQLTVIQSYAANPVGIFPDAGTSISDYKIELYDNNPKTYITFGQNFYADELYVFGNHVNFTNTALAASNFPTQNFGIGIENGNLTITGIDPSTVTTSLTCTVSSECNPFFYYRVVDPVYSVHFNIQGVIAVIPASSFYTNITSFNSASGPAVYQNVTGNYLKTKLTYSSPSTVTFYLNIGAETFIYADIGSSKRISAIELNHPDDDFIPASINVYISNSNTDWGSIDEVISLDQVTGNRQYQINPIQTGQYVKLEVNNFGSASSWQLMEFDLGEGVTIANEQLEQRKANIDSTIWTVLSTGMIIVAFFILLPFLKGVIGREDW